MPNIVLRIRAIERNVADIHHSPELRRDIDRVAIGVGKLEGQAARKAAFTGDLQTMVIRIELVLYSRNRIKAWIRTPGRESPGSRHRLIRIYVSLELCTFCTYIRQRDR